MCVCCVCIYIYIYLINYIHLYLIIFACRGVCVHMILTSACATALLIKVGPARAEGNFMTLRSVLSLQCYSHHFSSISFLAKHGQQPLPQHRPWELKRSRWKYSADPQHGSVPGAMQDKNQTHKVTWWSFAFFWFTSKVNFDNIFWMDCSILYSHMGWLVGINNTIYQKGNLFLEEKIWTLWLCQNSYWKWP